MDDSSGLALVPLLIAGGFLAAGFLVGVAAGLGANVSVDEATSNDVDPSGTPAGVQAVATENLLYEAEVSNNIINVFQGETGSVCYDGALKINIRDVGIQKVTLTIVNDDVLKKHFDHLVLDYTVDNTQGAPGNNKELMVLTLNEPSDTTKILTTSTPAPWKFDVEVFYGAKGCIPHKVPIVLKVEVEEL